MNSREFEFLHQVMKERQTEVEYELAQEALLRDPSQQSGTRRRLLLSLAFAAILVVAIIASGAHLFV